MSSENVSNVPEGRQRARGSRGRVVTGGRTALLLVLAAQELDVHLRAVDAHELAAAIGETGRGQQQEELLQVQPLDRSLDREDRVGVGDGVEHAVAAPSSVDGHDADIVAAAERDTLGTLAILSHVTIPLWQPSAA